MKICYNVEKCKGFHIDMRTEVKTLWVVGDSTVSAFNDNYYMPRTGWGSALALYFNDKIEVKNLAVSGTSSKSFTECPEYESLLAGMKAGDFLMIGFGHNDEKRGSITFTDPKGDYKEDGSFANSLYMRFIVPAKKRGVSCTLVTPIVRRDPDKKYGAAYVHVTADGDYAEAVRKLGRDINITVCDLTELTRELSIRVDSDDEPCNDTLFMHARTGSRELCVDNTHTSYFGAAENAYLIAGELKKKENPLVAFLLPDIADPLLNAKYWVEKSINHSYKDPVYKAPERKSKLWTDYIDEAGNVWQGTVFGDICISEEGRAEREFFLGKAENGAMKIEAGRIKNNGKIMEKSDGIAMYYARIPVGSHFNLKAEIKVKDFFSAGDFCDFSAFGAMVRDDMYIDEENGLIMGDYVAAGVCVKPGFETGSNTFARKSGLLFFGGGSLAAKPEAGDVIKVSLYSTGDGFAAQVGENAPVIAGYDYTLNAVDTKYTYVGFFSARSIGIEVTDISFIHE